MNGYEKLKRQLDDGVRPIKIDFPGQKGPKNVKPYYTFLGRDAIDALRKWMVYRAKDAEAISTNTRGKPLIVPTLYRYWLRKLKRLCLVKPEEPEYLGNGYWKNLARKNENQQKYFIISKTQILATLRARNNRQTIKFKNFYKNV